MKHRDWENATFVDFSGMTETSEHSGRKERPRPIREEEERGFEKDLEFYYDREDCSPHNDG